MSKLKDSKHLTIPFEEIKEATKNFQDCIGRGGYGQVYKGELLISGHLTTVAVKRLNEKFGQGLKEFLTEIDLLKDQKHPNLISLLGYCDEGKEKIIVYEYAKHRSLDRHLISDTLTWLERLRICVDIARGLDHLHNHVGKHRAIIHRDIKSSNVLLDSNWVAKISDLGLSKFTLADLDRSAVISVACGTRGYVDPVYISTGILKKGSDVYSFGVVLLEMLCGRLCTGKDVNGYCLFHYYETKKLHEIISPSLRQQTSSVSMNRFLAIAYGCLHEQREQRHPMNHVVKELEELLKFEVSLVEKQDWSSDSFNTQVTLRTKVGNIFDIFDLNRDGCLSRKELAAFLLVTNYNARHGEEHIGTCVDDVFWYYDQYVYGEKGLTYHGLLQYYHDGRGDLDSDIMQVVLDSDSDNDDEAASGRCEKLIKIFQKLNSSSDGGHNGAEIAARKSLLEEVGGLLVKVFHWFHKYMDRKRGLTCDSQFKMDGDEASDSGIDSEAIWLVLKPHIDDESALWFSSPKNLITTEPLTVSPVVSLILIIVFTLSIATMLVKLKVMWFLLLILFLC